MAGDGHDQNDPGQNGHDQNGPGQNGPGQDAPGQDASSQEAPDQYGPQPTRQDKRLYLTLMTVCIGLFVLSWAVLDRYSRIAAIVVSAVALVIPPFAVIIANVASATDRRRPLTALSQAYELKCRHATPKESLAVTHTADSPGNTWCTPKPNQYQPWPRVNVCSATTWPLGCCVS
jgi:hypothetical protein